MAQRIGVSKSAICLYESGKRFPGVEPAMVLCDFFGFEGETRQEIMELAKRRDRRKYWKRKTRTTIDTLPEETDDEDDLEEDWEEPGPSILKYEDDIACGLTSTERANALTRAANDLHMSYGNFVAIVTEEEKAKIYREYTVWLKKRRAKQDRMAFARAIRWAKYRAEQEKSAKQQGGIGDALEIEDIF